jgi:hypothetical protein
MRSARENIKTSPQGGEVNPKTESQVLRDSGLSINYQSEVRFWWAVRLPDGTHCRIVALGQLSYAEALEAVRWRWPTAEIVP